MIFAATTGEEVGLLGTRWYMRHPVVPVAQMSANLEIEMIGRPDSLAGGPGRAWLTGFERSTMGPTFARAGLPIGPDKRLDQQFFERSDNIAFARLGVPAHTLSSYNMHTDYHEPSDDLAHVDIPHMTAVIRAGAAAARLLADGEAPRWNPNGRPAAPASSHPDAAHADADARLARADDLGESSGACSRKFITVKLEADTASLTRNERRMLPLLVDAAREMHDVVLGAGRRPARFACCRRSRIPRRGVSPTSWWGRGIGSTTTRPSSPESDRSPHGANFYPRDMTKAEFEREVQAGRRARGQPQVAGTR